MVLFINVAPKYYRQSHKDPVVRIKNTLPLHMVKHWVVSVDITNTWIHQQQGVPHFSFTSSLFQTRKKKQPYTQCVYILSCTVLVISAHFEHMVYTGDGFARCVLWSVKRKRNKEPFLGSLNNAVPINSLCRVLRFRRWEKTQSEA